MIKQILFLFIGIFINAQTSFSVIEGAVLNDKEEPIPNATVMIKDDTYQYTVHTNDSGYFSKKIYAARKSVSIIITAPNYAKIEKNIVPNNEKYVFHLPYKYKEIEEVVIKKGITYKGDSTIYDADFYANKKEDKVIDLLKKLPNVDVNRAGKITINGKEISKILVESETFFTGSSSLAINSLPANSVDKFEFIENFSENTILGGNSEKTVLNIALKEDKKKIVFGDFLLNGDSWERYNAGANLFYYSPKTKVNLISNINNINKSIFKVEDYMSFNGGTDRLLRDPMSFMSGVITKDLLELITPSEKFKNVQIFNAVNGSQKILKDKFKVSVFNINNHNITEELKEHTLVFNDEKVALFNRTEYIDKHSHNKSNIFNLILNNENNEKIDFQYILSVKKSNTDVEQSKNIRWMNSNSIYNSINKYQNSMLNQTLDVSYKISENHSQGWLINMMSFNNDSERLDTADNKLFFHSIFNLSNDKNSILQNNFDRNNYIRVNFQHKYNILTYHQIGINTTISSKNQNINNYFSINKASSSDLSSKMALNRDNISVGVEYLFKNRFFTLSLTGDFVKINTDFKSDNNTATDKLQYILPKMKFEYKNRKIGTFNLNYKRDLKDIPIHYYYLGSYLISNSYVFTGNETLENPITDFFSFNYNKKSGRYGYSIDFQYDFSNELKGYMNNTKTTSIEKTNSIDFTSNIGKKQEFELRLEKQLFKNKISIISLSNISFEKMNVKINSNDDISEFNSRSFNLSVKSRFKGNYNFEIYNQFKTIDMSNSLTKNWYKQNETGFSLNFTPTEKWAINAELSYHKDLVNNLSFSKSTMKIDYYVNSKIYFNFFMNNVLGSYSKTILSNEEYMSYHQKEKLMPRFFNFGVTYKL